MASKEARPGGVPHIDRPLDGTETFHVVQDGNSRYAELRDLPPGPEGPQGPIGIGEPGPVGESGPVGSFTNDQAAAVIAEFYAGSHEYQMGVPPVTGDPVTDDTWVRNEAASEDGKITTLEVFSLGAGTFKFYLFDKAGLTFTAAQSVSLPVVAGLNTFSAPADFAAIPIVAGQYVGQYSGTLIPIADLSGAGLYPSAAGDNPTFTSGGLLAGYDLSFRATITVDELLDFSATFGAPERASSSYLGQINVVAGTPGSDTVWVMDQTIAEDCSVTAVRCYASGAGTLFIETFSRVGDDFTRTGQVSFPIVAGVNNVTLAAPLSVAAGEYIGFYGGALIPYSGDDAELAYHYAPAGHVKTFTSAAVLANNRFNLGVFLTTDEILQSASIEKQGRAGGRFRSRFAFIDNTGQSLSEGSNGTITAAQEHGNLGFKAATADPITLFPLTVANTQVGARGENPSYGCLGNIKQLLAAESGISEADDDFQLVACTNGVSGYSILQLNQGTAPYNDAIAQVKNLVTLRPDAGFWATMWTQGESDTPMSQATYAGYLMTYATQKADDAKVATGQSYDPIVVVAQMCSNSRPISYAHLQSANEHPLIICAGPTYQFTYYDYQHRDAAGTKRCGGLMGLALKRHLIDGLPWEPLQPIQHAISGNNIDLFFNKDGLTIDTVLMPAQANYGFDVRNAADVAQAISSVTILSPRRVRIALTAPPAAGWSVYYGRADMTGRTDAFIGGGGNLRDNQGDRITYSGAPLHNWCVLFNYPL